MIAPPQLPIQDPVSNTKDLSWVDSGDKPQKFQGVLALPDQEDEHMGAFNVFRTFSHYDTWKINKLRIEIISNRY